MSDLAYSGAASAGRPFRVSNVRITGPDGIGVEIAAERGRLSPFVMAAEACPQRRPGTCFAPSALKSGADGGRRRLSSWRPQGRHPRLSAASTPQGVNAGLPGLRRGHALPGMTEQQRPCLLPGCSDAYEGCARHDGMATAAAILTSMSPDGRNYLARGMAPNEQPMDVASRFMAVFPDPGSGSRHVDCSRLRRNAACHY